MNKKQEAEQLRRAELGRQILKAQGGVGTVGVLELREVLRNLLHWCEVESIDFEAAVLRTYDVFESDVLE